MVWRFRHFAVAFAIAYVAGTPIAYAADCVVAGADVQAATLRKSPSSSAASAGVLRQGESRHLIAAHGAWYEIDLSDGKHAFASKRATDLAPCSESGSGQAATGSWTLYAIDVGTGLSLLVRGPDFTLMYDAGSNDDFARGARNRVLAFLQSLTPAITKIDHVVLSHPHKDHVELLPDVLAAYPIGDVWDSGAYNDICGYRDFLENAAKPGIRYHSALRGPGDDKYDMPAKTCYGRKEPAGAVTLHHGTQIADNMKVPLGAGATMTFLHADGSKQVSFNENSLVVRLDLGDSRVLLMGDAEAGGRKDPSTKPADNSVEGELLACCKAELRADVMVVGHHGSKTSSRTALLDAVGAKYFVVSSGPHRYSGTQLPDSPVIDQLTSRGTLFRTDRDDSACAHASKKIGTPKDGKPGGCDNVMISFTANHVITAGYDNVQ